MILPCKCQARGCKHYEGVIGEPDAENNFSEVNERHVCAAFPNGIPEEILVGDNLHLKPVEGDGGIVFEPWHALSNK